MSRAQNGNIIFSNRQYIGSTHVANPEDFLMDVKNLTGKVAPSDQHQFENHT